MANGLISARFVTSVFDHAKAPTDRRPAVAFAGRSNVGKSSLINAITEGRPIARVSATPGKTQSLNFFMGDDRFFLVDLPGYGYAKAPHAVKDSWGRLVEGYLMNAPYLRGLILLVDCRRDFQADDRMLLEWLAPRRLPVLLVLTKTDKLTRVQLDKAVKTIRRDVFGDDESGGLIPFSAKTGQGKKEVVQWIRQAAS
ncbi:MAG: YihA family ribosome biogenesis GTP-binding protein [candidate division Zixibacteria bacterium]|nr:YihA family ribosome biogenesis GTP-binding protein [candidate division Zixibacteria bacterium]